MFMSAAKLAGAFAVGGLLLGCGGCGDIARIARGPCGNISHELASLKEDSDGENLYSARHASSFRDAAGEIALAGLQVDKSGQSVANGIANELEQVAAKLETLPPGEKIVYIVRGSEEKDLPRELQESCIDPDPNSDF